MPDRFSLKEKSDLQVCSEFWRNECQCNLTPVNLSTPVVLMILVAFELKDIRNFEEIAFGSREPKYSSTDCVIELIPHRTSFH